MSLVAKQLHVQESTVPMSHDDAMAIIERASRDKYLSRDLEQMRERCFSFVNQMMDEVTLALAEKEKRVPALLKSRPDEVSVRTLRASAQQREEAARKRRELAEAMVLGALFNMDNPDWDPCDPTTHRQGENFLVTLLKSAFK